MTMGKLIDADALIAKCGNWYTEEGTEAGFIGTLKQLLDEQPEAVVRCRDCKYQNKGSNEVDAWNLCDLRSWLYIPISDDFFCSYGERRTDE